MYRYLSGRLKQLGIRQKDLAEHWGVSQATVSNRFRGITPWNIDEMYELLSMCLAKPEELHVYFPKGGRAS